MPDTYTEFTPRQLELIAILQEVATKLGHTPDQNYFVNKPEYPGKTIFIDEFDGWNRALRAANLPLNRSIPIYTHKQLATQINAKCLALGRAPLRKDVEDDPQMASPDTYLRTLTHNGDWADVITASGFTINWSTPGFRHSACNALWQLYEELDFAEPTMFDIQNSSNPDIPRMAVVTNVFGGLVGFLIASGVRSDYIQRERQKIINSLRQYDAEYGHPPYEDDPTIDNSKIRRFFGSHNEAVRAADLAPNRQYYTKSQLLKDLRRQYDRTKKTPTHESIDADPTMASASTYRYQFKSLDIALKKAHVPLGIHRRGYDPSELDTQLARKTRKLQRVPTQKEINADPEMASVPTFVRHYGSWKATQSKARDILVNAG